MAVLSQQRSVRSHGYDIAISLDIGKIQSNRKSCLDSRGALGSMSCILAKVYLRAVAGVFVVEVTVVEIPTRSNIVMLVDHGYIEFASQLPTGLVVSAFQKGPAVPITVTSGYFACTAS